MSNVRYLVAKYEPDLFRREPRNIGVIVADGERVAMRFLGQQGDGVDLRFAPTWIQDGSLYAEWFAHWRRTAEQESRAPQEAARALATFLEGGGDMFRVWEGGEYIPEQDAATLDAVTEELFRDLVIPPGGAEEEQGVPALARFPLYQRIHRAFAGRRLLEKRRRYDDPNSHLIKVDVTVEGTLSVPHRPKFSQINGVVTVMEGVDFSALGEDKVRDHALSTAYMFEDVYRFNVRLGRPVEAIALISYAADEDYYPQKVGLAALADAGVRLVDWGDPQAQHRFLEERVRAAQSIAA